jgi:hypothetical protein
MYPGMMPILHAPGCNVRAAGVSTAASKALVFDKLQSALLTTACAAHLHPKQKAATN